jgi:hypothetical protein
MQLSKRLVQFLKTDDAGKFGVVVSIDNGVVAVDLEDGLTAKLEGKTKGIGVGDKVYFDDEGKHTNTVAAPKRERTKAADMPRQGSAYVKHEI